jgi:hypothetical protein
MISIYGSIIDFFAMVGNYSGSESSEVHQLVVKVASQCTSADEEPLYAITKA